MENSVKIELNNNMIIIPINGGFNLHFILSTNCKTGNTGSAEKFESTFIIVSIILYSR